MATLNTLVGTISQTDLPFLWTVFPLSPYSHNPETDTITFHYSEQTQAQLDLAITTLPSANLPLLRARKDAVGTLKETFRQMRTSHGWLDPSAMERFPLTDENALRCVVGQVTSVDLFLETISGLVHQYTVGEIATMSELFLTEYQSKFSLLYSGIIALNTAPSEALVASELANYIDLIWA